MTDDEIFTAAAGQGLVVSTGILGDLVLPAGAFDPERADEIRELAAQAAVYATQARGPGTLRAYPLGLAPIRCLVRPPRPAGAERRSPVRRPSRRRRDDRHPAVGQGGGPAGQGHRRSPRRRRSGVEGKNFRPPRCRRPALLFPQSLRARLATAAAEAEAQIHDVMRQTPHKSVDVARRYMRSSDLWRNNVTEKVMRPT